MKSIRVVTVLLLLLAGVMAYWVVPHPEIESQIIDRQWIHIAETMGIQNMVTAVYLGPRVMDTFIEVMVVILTVLGMHFLRESP